MLKAHFQDGAHMVVGEGVVHDLPLAAKLDEVRQPQHLELVRHRRLRHAQQRGEVANAELVQLKRVQQPRQRRVAEKLEQLRQLRVLLRVAQLAADLRDRLLVDDLAFAQLRDVHIHTSFEIVEQSFNYLHYTRAAIVCQ